MKIEPDFVLFLDCSEEEMKRRLLNRNQVSKLPFFFFFNLQIFNVSNFSNSFSCILSVDLKGRVDDNINTIQKRLKVYFECTLPVINYYSAKGKVRKVTIFSTKLLIVTFHGKWLLCLLPVNNISPSSSLLPYSLLKPTNIYMSTLECFTIRRLNFV